MSKEITKKQHLLLIFLTLLPSLLLVLFVPPSWNYIDSYMFITPHSLVLVPQHQPLYLVVCQVFMKLASYNWPGVSMLIIFQHLVYLAGLLWLVYGLRAYRARILLTIFMGLNWGLLILVHGVYMEALFCGLLVGLLGFVVRVLNADEKNGVLFWLGFAMVLWALMTTRHIGILFAALLPGVMLGLVILNRGAGYRKYLGAAGIAIAMSVIAFAGTKALNAYVKHLYPKKHEAQYGKPGVYRIAYMQWDKMPKQERKDILEGYKLAAEGDSILIELFDMLATNDPDTLNLWIGVSQRIINRIEETGSPHTYDYYFNKATIITYQKPNRYLVWAITKDVFSALRANMLNDATISSLLTYNGSMNFDMRVQSVYEHYKDASQSFYQALDNSWLNNMGMPILLIMLMFILTARYTYIHASPNMWWATLMIILFALLVLVANCIVTIHLGRYMMPTQVLCYTATATLLATAIANRKAKGLQPTK